MFDFAAFGGALFAAAFVAAALEFLAFELVENPTTNVFRAFATSWRSAFLFAGRRVFPYFFATIYVFFALAAYRFDETRLLATLGVFVGVGGLYVFLASGPIWFLAATERRLFCDKEEGAK